ncbi:SoxR reducing system RseC family protein [Marinospirillum perlucidum]|uniref:SoxR reducing system RseC family protein n=1 Tax=Marinospirillum perlucidum TaxID=1982602 RepID=UPI000DF351ED|nr:SoxR reducing system RseC family protein [Marinospirillum perlucidum]
MSRITQEAEVIACQPGLAWVRPCAREGCSSCSLSGACGQGLISRWLLKRQPLLQVSTCEQLVVGDRVQVGVSTATLNRAAWLQFALPLLTLLVAAILAEYLAFSASWQQLIFAALGLLGGLAVARFLAGNSRPEFVRKLTSREVSLQGSEDPS